MQNMTLEQLRAAASAGGVTGVTVKGQGGGFFVEIATRSGQDAFLVKARSSAPRRFGNPASTMLVLRAVGIELAQLDASGWTPGHKDMSRSREGSAQAMREAHEAAAWNRRLMGEIQASMDDPRPSIPHAEVMAAMDTEIAALQNQTRA